MKYKIEIDTSIEAELIKIWGLPTDSKILDVTPFGDFFARLPDTTVILISATDGEVKNVTKEINEFGLPPVEIELGDEWYQLDAQAGLEEEGFKLNSAECFGFKQPLFLGGDYSPENIETINICNYHSSVFKLYSQTSADPIGTIYTKVAIESE